MDLFEDLPDPSGDYRADGSEKGNSNADKVKKEETAIPTKRKAEVLEECADKGLAVQKARTDSAGLFGLTSFVADRKGEREEMQDAHVQLDTFTLPDLHPSIGRVALYAVFDGHGGVRASRFASQYLQKILRDKFPKGDLAQVEKEIKKCLIEVFKKLDEDFLKQASKQKPFWKDGSTAVVVLVLNNTLYIANLGDSKSILCRSKPKPDEGCLVVPLTLDHSPSLYSERMRIQKAGGNVRDGRVMGILEVSRSLGDGPYKNHGVTCLPDVKRCQLTPNDRYIMLACDGLWKSFTMDESIQFVNKVLQDQSIHATDRRSAEEVRYDTACSRLANTAVLRLSGDNVTVMIVSIKPAPS